MTEREAVIEKFLATRGWGGAARKTLAGDASFRRYDRLTDSGRGAVLMDAPPPKEDVDAFVAIARHLKSLGFSAPEIFAKDKENGLLIIEDLGDETFNRVLAKTAGNAGGAVELDLYGLAVDVLVELHRIDPDRALPPGMEDYDDAKLLDEATLLTDWTWPAVFGEPPPGEVLDAYRDAWLQVFPIVHRQPQTLVLRDFHVDNLLVLDGRYGVARCGLLDFQDAVRGACAYDLMSLLEDARRDIGSGFREAMLERYLDTFPDLDGGEFKTVYAILAAQRHAKVLGIFTRLCRRDDKPAYLEHIPRVWRLLEAALGHQALAPVAAWFDTHVPPDKRGVPPCLAAGA